MTNNNSSVPAASPAQMLSKVPQITVFFWIIKVLCTTVGETASDFLNVNLGFGLTGTSVVTGVLLLVSLFFQFRAKKYVPGIYWLTVVLISVFGTLVTDNMTDAMGVPLEVSTIGFSILLALTFAAWYIGEKTLSIHSIFTVRREAFYWLTILFTFALGTASGDLMSESLGLGYLVTGIIVIAVISAVGIAWKMGMDSVLSFWIAYIMTRPLGASLGDYMSQPHKYGGLGLGATITSFVFLGAILLTVVFLAVTKVDLNAPASTMNSATGSRRMPVFLQVVSVVCVLTVLSGAGYQWRHTALLAEADSTTATATATAQSASSSGAAKGASVNATGTTTVKLSKLGDLSVFQKNESDTLAQVSKGDLSKITSQADDLEYTWDQAEAKLKPRDPAKWHQVDNSIDAILRQLRAVNPNAAACKATLEKGLTALQA